MSWDWDGLGFGVALGVGMMGEGSCCGDFSFYYLCFALQEKYGVIQSTALLFEVTDLVLRIKEF